MGIIMKLRESMFRVRVVPKQTAEDTTSFTKEKDSAIKQIWESIDSGKRVDLTQLLNIVSLEGNRELKYRAYEEMIADGRIGAAVEMYANDTVQYNPQGKIIWVESTDSEVATYANNLLADLNIAESLWSIAYCLWLYGDVYLELFEDVSYNKNKPSLLLEPVKTSNSLLTQKNIEGAKLERYIKKVPNSAEIWDLQSKGKTSGFIRSNLGELENTTNNGVCTYSYVNSSINNVTILSPTRFVHICLSPNINRFPERFNFDTTTTNILQKDENGFIDGDAIYNNSLTFEVKTGQSILENVFGPYQTLKLKEDSVLLERITKSSITRVIQVELGDLPEQQKKKKLQEIKNQIEQQLIMNKDTGVLQSRPGAQPTENIIYTTTKDGKGTISTVNIGGDAQIGTMEDIEQAENKVYGSLLTPKAILGGNMEGSGLSNGGSLTELNTTYARRIKRGQVALISGIKTLIDIFAISDGLGEKVVGNFDVKLTPITTVEDNRRDELLQTKIRNVNDILSILNDIDSIDEKTKLNMIVEWLGKYLNQQDIVDIINNRIKEIESKESKDKEINTDGLDSEEIDIKPNSKDFNPEPVNTTDLSEIEGQDLV